MVTDPTARRRAGPLQRGARLVYLALAAGFLAAVVLQVFFAGVGVLSDAAYLAYHVRFIEWFQPIPVLLLVAAFMGKLDRKAKIAPVAIFIALVLQYEFVNFRPHVAAGLHTVNALFIFWLSLWIVRRGWSARHSDSRDATPAWRDPQGPPSRAGPDTQEPADK